MFKSRKKEFIFVVVALVSVIFPSGNAVSDTKVTSMEIRQGPAPEPLAAEEYVPYAVPSPTVTLMISGYMTVGTGAGTIRIETTGAECKTPNFCQYTFNRGQKLTLRAIPDPGSTFPGWYILFKDDNGGFINTDQPCPEKVDICELTLDNGAVVAPPLFLPDLDVDLAVKSLTASPKDLPVGGIVTLSTVVENLGTDNSLGITTSVGLSQIQRYMSSDNVWVTNIWGWSSDTFSSTLNAGAQWSWSGQSIPLPREGKYIAESRVSTPVDSNRNNDVLKEAVYVTAQANAVVKGKIYRYYLSPIIKPTTVILSGPENRSLRLSRNATSYSFSNLKLGQYTLTINSAAHQPVQHTFEILSGTQIKNIPIGLKYTTARKNRAPIAVAAATPTEGNLSQTFTLSAAGSRDPDKDPLRYIWDFGDGFTYREGSKVQYRFWNSGIQTIRLTVIDIFGASATYDLTINVINDQPTRPRPEDIIDIGDPNINNQENEFWGAGGV